MSTVKFLTIPSLGLYRVAIDPTDRPALDEAILVLTRKVCK